MDWRIPRPKGSDIPSLCLGKTGYVFVGFREKPLAESMDKEARTTERKADSVIGMVCTDLVCLVDLIPISSKNHNHPCFGSISTD